MSGRKVLAWLPAFLLAVGLGCGGGSTTSPTPVDPLAGFTSVGDPAAAAGARWTYRANIDSAFYDLEGILLKPSGSGPFPAVVISHGATGSAGSYALAVARVMVSWGLVCIATNYTHSGGVPIGAPGTASEVGASRANVLRARRLVEFLRGLRYVDMNRVALHGHSLGAFVTTATASAYPDLFRVASHTAGGVVPDSLGLLGAPSVSQIAGLRAPYQMHHGDRDFVIPLAADELLAATLAGRGVVHELVTYAGVSHNDVSVDPVVMDRIQEWYRQAGMF